MRWLDAFGTFLGWVVWALHVRRGVVMSNLRLAFPEKSEAERREIARRTFLNLGRMITDFLRVPSLTKEELERLFVYEGWDVYEQAKAEGKGVVACTGHFGNFDLLAATVVRGAGVGDRRGRDRGPRGARGVAALGPPALADRGRLAGEGRVRGRGVALPPPGDVARQAGGAPLRGLGGKAVGP